MWILSAALLFLLIAIFAPDLIYRRPNGSAQRDAVSNARQIGLALFEFETEYGRFPDESTAPQVIHKTRTKFNLGSSSANDYFRQLIAAEYLSSKQVFYAETAFTEKPQFDQELGDNPLGPGSAGFGYLLNGRSAFSTEGNPARPIVCAPLAFDGKTASTREFDYRIYEGKAIILRVDNSVSSVPILKKSRFAAIGGGKTLLDTGLDTVWGESVTPVIVPPLPKR
jgi:hypothetical protein